MAKSNARRKYKDATGNRLKKGHQQREANHKGSEKEEEIGHDLSVFPLTSRPRKLLTFFYQSSFDTNFSL